MVVPVPYYQAHGHYSPLTALTVGILSSLPFVNKQRSYGVPFNNPRRRTHSDHYDRQHHIDVDHFKVTASQYRGVK